ncbi:hypothetical protein Cch01nite_27230 [Cellulomonas chitinilytica]|uniref:DUF11 domain-containing protein n=1 Tax=Cellulomonas chitinilytica TaxID=398759 RepID=A0A919U3C2_9CELL|nr:DUF11 domain-containing protein [Cellulomonas chitinilytica]GIG21999.1 hypothetical protein Cch01nite_27230 [Cellulomonas chitinilytica]
MAGARAWAAGLVAGTLLVSGAAGASAAGPLGGAVVAALPVPVAAAPRVGFTDRTDELREVHLDWQDVIINLAGGTPAGPAPVGEGLVGEVLGEGTTGGGILGGGTTGAATLGGGTTGGSTTGGGTPLAVLAAPVMPPVFFDPTPEDTPYVDGHRHDGEATAHTVVGDENPTDVAADLTWVSTAAQDDPAAPTGPEDPGEVYYRDLTAQSAADARVTCDPATEVHPSVSPDGTRIAYATNAHGTWDIAVAPVSTDSTCPKAEPTWVTHGEGDSTWPAWLDDGTLVFSSTRDDELGDLFVAAADGTGSASPLTDGPGSADTQPDVRATATGWLVAFTTTRYRPDGSIGLLGLTRDLKPDPAVGPDGLRDPFADAVLGTPQGSEPVWSLPGSPWAVAFTSTWSDPSGDIMVAAFTPDAAALVDYTTVAGTFRRAESHPTWLSFTDTGSAQDVRLVYTSEVGTPDVSDAVADDGSDIREISRSALPLDPDDLTPSTDLSQAGLDYSPDGQYVVYSVQRGAQDGTGWALQIARADTLEVVESFEYDRVGPDIDLNPTWSPDGSTIAFVRRPWVQVATGGFHAQAQIVTVDATDPTEPRMRKVLEITPEPAASPYTDLDPSWFPDSERLAFSRASGDTDDLDLRSIWTINTRTLTSEQIRFCSSTTTCRFTVPLRGRAPAVSPDGTQIAVASLLLDADGADPLDIATPGNIGIVDIDETTDGIAVTGTSALTGFRPDGSATDSRRVVATADQPDWSPDGAEIAFSGSPATGPEARGIWAVSPEGTGLRRIVDRPGPQRSPAYQPFTDMVLTMSASPPTGGGATVTAVATNAGPGLVRSATVSVELPPGLTSPGATGCTVAAAVLTCAVDAPMSTGDTASFEIPVTGIDGAATTTVTGVVTTPTPERVVTNNSASVELGVAGGVGVTVSIESPGIVYTGGQPLRATYTVRNAGGLPAQAVTLTTGFGAPLVPVPAGGPSCLDAAGTCALGTLAPGAALVLTASVGPPPSPPLPALSTPTPALTAPVTGAVATTSPDPNPADDVASANLEVRQPSVVLTPATARPGEVVFAVGQDFPPGAPVQLSWSQGLMSVASDPDSGTGTWSQAVVLLDDTLLSARLLQVEDRSATPAYGPARARLLVVPTSVDAPTFLFRK